MVKFLGVLCGALLVSGGASAQDLGTVLFATPKCAVIDGPMNVALVTGKLELKKGDLVSGEFDFHSYGELSDTSGRIVGVDVFVEETTTALTQLPAVLGKLKGKC